ncbi:hypothetical protein PAXINDRAFT_13153 [Paxillus involutus ATCC 200175]|uniref:Unplaced genomic scaffold PAXINscaffold_24, whole genome shotgun sequence n=1 Tax=Paxillus involutus ATCC 200175 TaxID=664439 RepID=A0A0C9U3E7_PAXIN|nr:hypothetical protein PAXINDRAFT_13153 [Paxillus involutus ATCC 200175]
MSPTSNTSPEGECYPEAPPQKKEIYGSKERMEHNVAAPALTVAQETKLWRRIDLRLLPVITLIYLLCSMDRGNIGNATLEGLLTQLNLTGNKFNIALMMYSIPFILLELPSKWLPGIMILWGLITMSMGFVKTYPQLVGVRVCLGAAEAGIDPGIAYYLTLWYPKYMFQYRMALFTAGAALAGAFSGLLAYSIGFMKGDGGLEGWSWIFILEGVATVLLGLIAALVMVDYPSTAKFLTTDERSFVVASRGGDDAQDEKHDMSQQVWAAFTDWQVWALAVVQASVTVPAYAISYFLPTIIHNFGYSTSLSQLLTVPPFALGAVTALVFAHFSDKLKVRSPFIFAGQSIALLGYIINLTDAPSGVKYFGTHLCIMGSFSSGPGAVSWLANNLRGKYKRAVGMALQISVGNLGGVIGSNILRTQDAPRYLLGHGLAIMFISIGLTTISIVVLVYKRLNARLDHDELLETQHAEPSLQEAPGFRYTL